MPPTNELKDLNLFKDCKRAKSDEGKKAATNLTASSLSTDTYITNTEKESKLRNTEKESKLMKTGIKYQENVHDIS